MTEDVAALRNAVSRELSAQYALRSEVIRYADLPEIAYAVAANLLKEFQIEPRPSAADPDLADRDPADQGLTYAFGDRLA